MKLLWAWYFRKYNFNNYQDLPKSLQKACSLIDVEAWKKLNEEEKEEYNVEIFEGK